MISEKFYGKLGRCLFNLCNFQHSAHTQWTLRCVIEILFFVFRCPNNIMKSREIDYRQRGLQRQRSFTWLKPTSLVRPMNSTSNSNSNSKHLLYKQMFRFLIKLWISFSVCRIEEICFAFGVLLWIYLFLVFRPWLNWRKIQYYNRINVITLNFMQQLLHYELIWLLFRFHFHSCQNMWSVAKFFFYFSILFRWGILSLFSKFQMIIRQ